VTFDDLDDMPFVPAHLVAYLDQHVHGHSFAKRRVSQAIWWNLERKRRITRGEKAIDLPDKCNILISGPPGQGKTLLVRTIGNALHIPVFVTQATSFSAAGFVGANVEDMIEGLFRRAGCNVEWANMGAIFIDELDKVGIRAGIEPGKDVSGRGVQNALLPLLSGTDVPVSGGIVDTTGISFFGAGSFQGMAVSPEEREHVRGDKLISFGFIPELVGRFPIRLALSPLSANEMAELLVKSKSSPLIKMQNLLKSYGSELVAEEAWIRGVVTEALRMQTGVRALNEIVGHLLSVLIEVVTQLPRGSKVLLTEKGMVLPKLNPPRAQRTPFPFAKRGLPAAKSAASPPARPENRTSPPATGNRVNDQSSNTGQAPPAKAREFTLDDLGPPSWKEEVPPPKKRFEPPKSPSALKTAKDDALGLFHEIVSSIRGNPAKSALAVVLCCLLGMLVAGFIKPNSPAAVNGTRPPAAEQQGETKRRVFPELDWPAKE
jgi:ATP-dependent Clp protease ATP-binding subunit ClpX